MADGKSSDSRELWEIILGLATLIGVVLAAASVKESRNLICRMAVDQIQMPVFCDFDPKLSFFAFHYRNSSDGVMAADVCLPDPGSIIAQGGDINLIPRENIALCWSLNLTHPEFSRTVGLPVRVTLEMPVTIYVNPATNAVSVTQPPQSPDFWRETRILDLGTSTLPVSSGIISEAQRRLIAIGGDTHHWPAGSYKLTVSSDSPVVSFTTTGNFTIQQANH